MGLEKRIKILTDIRNYIEWEGNDPNVEENVFESWLDLLDAEIGQ